MNIRRSKFGSLPMPLALVVVAALSAGGGATAAGLIDGKDIKKNTVTSKQIKNGTLKLSDIKGSEVAKLKGKDGANGTNGTNGTNGASAFAPPPSGMTIKGGGSINGQVSAGGAVLHVYTTLPFTLAAPTVDFGAGRNLWFGNSSVAAAAPAAEVNTTKCPGSESAPTALPGNVCVYMTQTQVVGNGTAVLFAGVGGGYDQANKSGFTVRATSSAAGEMVVRYVWVYTAP
jgi:hypothetical protein